MKSHHFHWSRESPECWAVKQRPGIHDFASRAEIKVPGTRTGDFDRPAIYSARVVKSLMAIIYLLGDVLLLIGRLPRTVLGRFCSSLTG